MFVCLEVLGRGVYTGGLHIRPRIAGWHAPQVSGSTPWFSEWRVTNVVTLSVMVTLLERFGEKKELFEHFKLSLQIQYSLNHFKALVERITLPPMERLKYIYLHSLLLTSGRVINRDHQINICILE